MIEGGKVGRRKRKEGVKTMPSGSEEPLKIFKKKVGCRLGRAFTQLIK